MKKHTVSVFAAFIMLSQPVDLFAWGKKGHGIAAEIAFSFLDSGTKQKVRNYLKGTSIEDASTWMDEMRSNHSFDYMKTWHYVNVEKGNEYVPNNDPNVVNEIKIAIENLSHKEKLNDSEIKTNLMVIFHLVEDMQMPLHVGYGSDKGGNDIKVTYLGKPSNLHRVWDSDIIESEGITSAQCLELYKDMDNADRKEMNEINIEFWIKEPRYQLKQVYDFNSETNVIDQAYVDRNKIVVERQLLVAGIRLAAVLRLVAG